MFGELAEILKSSPEVRPALFQAAAHENIGMVPRFFVFHSEFIPDFCYELTRREISFHDRTRKSHDDPCFGRRVAISVRPKRIATADYGRQSILRAQKIH